VHIGSNRRRARAVSTARLGLRDFGWRLHNGATDATPKK
jgi:hypothetical protein